MPTGKQLSVAGIACAVVGGGIGIGLWELLGWLASHVSVGWQ